MKKRDKVCDKVRVLNLVILASKPDIFKTVKSLGTLDKSRNPRLFAVSSKKQITGIEPTENLVFMRL